MKNIENMKNLIFREVPLLGQSLMQKLLKQLPEENAVIELNNLLANNLVKDVSIVGLTHQIRHFLGFQS